MREKHRLVGAGLWLLLTIMFVLSGSALASTTLAAVKTPLDGASSAKIGNVELAADSIDGTTMEIGQYFSFNDTVGPRTSSYGYKNAVNGRGVKVIGGGVAQVASTVYLALQKLDGITYEEKQTYKNFTDTYVSSKKNAIMVDYKADMDFSFYNDTHQAFRIDMWLSDDYLHCELIETDGSASAASASYDIGGAQMRMSGSAALENNVALAADSIYDTALCKGDSFSFNQTVGPCTERYGYQRAVDGRGEEIVGGGVAQVASLIYLAVKDMPSVEITEKSVYEDFNQDYVSSASDAIRVDYHEELDFRFTYNGDGAMYIYTHIEDGSVFCEIVEN